MLVALCIALVALVASLGLNGWLTYRAIGATQATADEREDHVATRGELERSRFELKNTQQALVAANKRAAALEEVLADEVARDDPLPPADVRGRVLRIARSWAEAAAARSPLPAGAGQAVPVDPATEPTEPGGLLPNGLMRPD